MANMPQWATPERRSHLTEQFEKYHGGCMLGYRPPEAVYHFLFQMDFFELTIADIVVDGDSSKCVCQGCPHHYLGYQERVIAYWKEDDREARHQRLRLEREILHATPDRTGWKRRFDPIEREKFFQRQGSYYIEGLGISGLTFKPIAKVRVPSTTQRLFVDVPKQDMNKMSRNARKRLRRRQQESIDRNCAAAVQDYWENL